MVFGLFEKGKIELVLDKMQFTHGETITGTATVKLNKAIQARGVFATLFAEVTSTRMTANGMQRSTQRAFEFSLPLDGEKEYSTTSYTYPIKLIIPAANAVKAPEGVMGVAVQAISFIAAGAQNTKWFVEVKLDIPKGFDVSKKVQINIG
ncbi:MAG: hypothetical protein NTY48_02190 [Candidatus Diapherotrites archaeon]|nr:hypothetical protein [Candidatus Diapherotrites archaeon]